MPGKVLDKFRGLFDGRAVDQRVAVKMHVRGRAPALHHVPGCHRRVYAARQHHRHLPAGPHRQAPVGRSFVKIEQYAPGLDIQVDRQIRVRKVNSYPRRFFHEPAQLPVHLG